MWIRCELNVPGRMKQERRKAKRWVFVGTQIEPVRVHENTLANKLRHSKRTMVIRTAGLSQQRKPKWCGHPDGAAGARPTIKLRGTASVSRGSEAASRWAVE